MNSNFTKLLMTSLATMVLAFFAQTIYAQIPNDSPFPLDFIVDSESGFSRQFEYSSMADFGVNLGSTVSGELVWGYDETGDSLMCNPTMDDLTGKMVLIRRGICNFSLKIWHAQDAGAAGVIIVNHTPNADGGGLVNMAGGDSAALVMIPAIFITWDDGEVIRERLDAGQSMTATFRLRSFFGDLGPYAYATPKDQARTLDRIQVELLNINEADPVLNVGATVEILEPDGNVVTLTTSKDEIPPASVAVMEFDDYLPEKVGLYQMTFTNTLTEDVLTRNFEITDYTFQMDNGDICNPWPEEDCWISTPYETFVSNFLIYDFGNVYYTGDNGGTVTHFTFSLGNPDSLYTDDPSADAFSLILYDADPDGDGMVPDETTYDNFTPLGFQTYILTGEETSYGLINVELDNPIALEPNGIYLLMVQYNGVNSGLGIPPWPTYHGTSSYAGFGEVVFTDQLSMSGFGGEYNLLVRMHMEGFTPVSTKALPPLDGSKVTLLPNPANDHLNVQLNLDNVADKAEMIITSVHGKLMMRKVVQNVQKETVNFDTSKLPAGYYFLSINTPEGFRAEKFAVAR